MKKSILLPLGVLLVVYFLWDGAVLLSKSGQILRPISPIAWIPIAILWFKVDDRAPIFLIFLSSLPRPRDLDSPEYLDVRDEIFHTVGMSLKVGAG